MVHLKILMQTSLNSLLVEWFIRVLIVNSLHFMKKLFHHHHETTKFRKHEICLIFFSCFRTFVLS